MSSCQCCVTPHPLRLLERYHSSIRTMKLIQKNYSIFENILLDEYEQLERIASKFNKYLMRYAPIFPYLSPLLRQLNDHLENRTKLLYELEGLMMKCSIWLKNYSTKQIHSQLKSSRKQFASLEKFIDQHSHFIEYKDNLLRKFWKDFDIFQRSYQQQMLQMDSMEYEYLKLFLHSIRLFSSIISSRDNENLISKINIEQNMKEWKEKNRYQIRWLPNEHLEKPVQQSASNIDIKPIDDDSSQDAYAYESNLSWSFTIPEMKEDLSIPSPSSQSTDISQATPSRPLNRVRLAIESIERNTKQFPRGRKS